MKSALHFLINLTPTERMKLRKVAEKRQGYVNDVMMAVKANPSVIPLVINKEEYYKDAQLFLDLSEISAQMITLFEGASDTFMASGNEAITTTDQCYGYLKQAAKGNINLSTTVKELSKHFAGQGRKAKSEGTISNKSRSNRFFMKRKGIAEWLSPFLFMDILPRSLYSLALR